MTFPIPSGLEGIIRSKPEMLKLAVPVCLKTCKAVSGKISSAAFLKNEVFYFLNVIYYVYMLLVVLFRTAGDLAFL